MRSALNGPDMGINQDMRKKQLQARQVEGVPSASENELMKEEDEGIEPP